MPPRNALRSLLTEEALASRVAYEREKRGMSYEGLADRMTKVGCAINQSGLYKIEKANPPRRITVEELVAFSKVFSIPVEQMLMPPELLRQQAVTEALNELMVLQQTFARAQSALKHGTARTEMTLNKLGVSLGPGANPEGWVTMEVPSDDIDHPKQKRTAKTATSGKAR